MTVRQMLAKVQSYIKAYPELGASELCKVRLGCVVNNKYYEFDVKDINYTPSSKTFVVTTIKS